MYNVLIGMEQVMRQLGAMQVATSDEASGGASEASGWFESASLEQAGCAQHVLLHYPVHRCRCRATGDERRRYNALLARAAALEPHQPAQRLQCLLDALALCDDDAALHRACITLGHLLAFQ
jgi:hypothetical protein